MLAPKQEYYHNRNHTLYKRDLQLLWKAKLPGELAVTCRNFRRCIHYVLGGYGCDHYGEHCDHFIEKQAVADLPEINAR